MRPFSRLLTILLALTAIHTAHAEELVTVPGHGGVDQRFLLLKPEGQPTAAVILFAGGHGGLGLSSFFGSPSMNWGKNNNLVRTREMYARHGFLVATVDAPGDRRKMNAIYRMSDEHAQDIAAVVDHLKGLADVPVWAVGTSMGSFSAANMGISLGDRIHGMVLSSSITQSPSQWSIADDYPNGVMDMPLDVVIGPVLLVSHQDDGCDKTPATDLPELAKRFTRASKVETALFSGGSAPESEPCQAMSQHGYIGIEQEVVDRTAAFIRES